MFCIITGDLTTGLFFAGPFETHQQAYDYGDRVYDGDVYTIADLISPEEAEKLQAKKNLEEYGDLSHLAPKASKAKLIQFPEN